MKILVTGSAGFIGAAVAKRLLDRGDEIIGIDNLDPYYDVTLKHARLNNLLIYPNFIDQRVNLQDGSAITEIFNYYRPQRVINLAAQAGVRYSLINPLAYVETNLVGFIHILENCRRVGVEHLVYASSSSVYGANRKMPYSVHNNVDHPLSIYAATKKANELMAHTYSHLYQLPTTGLRFFTVYGPWGRPDMAFFKFTRNILAGIPIDIYNYGRHQRDFTYIDDIVAGLVRIIDRSALPNPNWTENDPGTSFAPYRIYNIGNGRLIDLMDYIETLENCLGVKAEKNFLPLQNGDVVDTCADVADLINDFNFQPQTSITQGLSKFVAWYRDYYRV